MRSTILTTVLAAALLLAGCGGDDDEETTEAKGPAGPSADTRVDVTSGRPLSEFKDSPTYAFREALLANKAAVLAGMAEIDKRWAAGGERGAEKDLGDVLSTCDAAVNRKVTGDKLVEQTVTRFSGGSGEVTEKQAEKLIALAKKHVCPAA